MWSGRLRAIAREPLVWFLAAGVALFAADRWRQGEPPAAPGAGAPTRPAAAAPIVVGAEVRATLRDALARAAGGATPSEAAVDEAVARWVDEEVLYREG
ncbi:MAG TPA: hypothetical protein VFU21_15410, partial [Kofleriaceae bacterium]|nr:hypothetical protein [Kofleriaceae bacterium]